MAVPKQIQDRHPDGREEILVTPVGWQSEETLPVKFNIVRRNPNSATQAIIFAWEVILENTAYTRVAKLRLNRERCEARVADRQPSKQDHIKALNCALAWCKKRFPNTQVEIVDPNWL